MTNPVGAILFDLDGTLIDLPVDIEPVRRAVETMLAEAGESGPARPLLDAIDRAASATAKRSGETAAMELRARARRLIDAAEVAAAPRARARPGAVEAVAALARRGFRLAIVTDNSRACVAPALSAAGLGNHSWFAVTRDDVDRPKPAPDGTVLAARTLCPTGGPLWYAGDSPRDIAAARAAAAELGTDFHLRAVAILGGHATEETLRQSAPDHFVTDLTAFASLVTAP